MKQKLWAAELATDCLPADKQSCDTFNREHLAYYLMPQPYN